MIRNATIRREMTRRLQAITMALFIGLIANASLALAQDDLEVNNRRGQFRTREAPRQAVLVEDAIIIGPVPHARDSSRWPHERSGVLGKALQTVKGPFLKLFLRRHEIAPAK